MTVGLSLTDSDEHLLSYALMLARLGIARRYQFVHVLTESHPPGVGRDSEDALRQMRQLVSQQFGEQFYQVLCSFEVRKGARIDEMLAYLEQNPSGAVLVGHGSTNHGHRSLATRLAMTCPTSVWMIPNEAPCQIQGVLAPIDFSPHSADSLSLATALARQAGLSECLALHVYFNPADGHYQEAVTEVRRHEQTHFQQFIRPLEIHERQITALFAEESNVSNAICRIAVERYCNLIVMSTRGRSRAAAILLGSETLQTLTASPVPVLAVKHRGAFLNLFQALKDQKLWAQSTPKVN